jgi:flavin reductase (DIM6/NTAB) family NADH-FMN oxidoreductase RutF
MKIKCNIEKFYNFAFPMSTVLVTCNDENNKTNVITIAWHTTISKKPPLYGISIAPGRFSYDLIKKSGEFVINFTSFDLVDKVNFCGTHSGRKIDKIKNTKLTLIDSEKIKTPSIQECYAHYECILYDSFDLGDHTLFIGEVVNARVDDSTIDKDIIDNEKIQTCFYLGGNTYSRLDKNKKRL